MAISKLTSPVKPNDVIKKVNEVIDSDALKAPISTTVTNVSYNSTSKKIQKTIDGSTTDVVALSDVATSGNYNDLSNKPTIPTVSLNGAATTAPSFYAPTTAGTAGYVLTSTGSGAPTWQEAQGGGSGGGGSTEIVYATSDSRTHSLTATVADNGSFTLVTGARVVVKFTYDRPTEAQPYDFTLNVNSTGEKTIKCNGSSLSSSTSFSGNMWKANDLVEFLYDGTYWQMLDRYREASTTQFGVTHLSTATNSTSTTAAATPSAVKAAYDLANQKSRVTLNGSANTTPSFYAPTTGGTYGYILKSNGANSAPVWAQDDGDMFSVYMSIDDGEIALNRTYSEIVEAIIGYKHVFIEDYDYNRYELDWIDNTTNNIYFYKMGFVSAADPRVFKWEVRITNNNVVTLTEIDTSAVPLAATTVPVVDGTAATGSSTAYARADHVHPKITQAISMSNNVITLTGSDGTTSSVTLPVYNGGVQAV